MATRPRAPRNSEEVRQLLRSRRFLAADRVQASLGELRTWDQHLLREGRLLVPVQVEALYLAEDGGEPMLRLPMLLAGPNGATALSVDAGMPSLFSPGQPRPRGVHLHWAVPDALLQGRLEARTPGAANRLSLPPLPDRWLVLRLLLPRGGAQAVISGWVLQADAAVAVPLAQWKEGGTPPAGTPSAGRSLSREELVGTAGGSLNWAATYDAVLNRFALHDPLSDIAALAPQGVDQDCATYVVCGWWSDPRLDPLDAARSKASLTELLDTLGWAQTLDIGDANTHADDRRLKQALRQALNLKTGDVWSPAASAKPKAAPGAGDAAAFSPVRKALLTPLSQVAASAFRAEVAEHFTAPPWHLRSSLLHGMILGVPVAGIGKGDRRPAAEDLTVALGHQEDDVLAALARDSSTTEAEARASERLLSGFTLQKINRLNAPDGVVEIEEAEHAGGFAALPAGMAGDDRYLEPAQRHPQPPKGHSGLSRLAQHAAAQQAQVKGAKPAKGAVKGREGATLMFAGAQKPTLIAATRDDMAHARQQAQDREDATTPKSRVVARPAPRHTFATDPVLAIRGAARSLRHGGDGRDAARHKLACRWPSQVIQYIPGLVDGARFIATLGNGSLPPETLGLAREALLYDPYHHAWMAKATLPPGLPPKAVFMRLQAESAIRFSPSGAHDGSTAAFDPTRPATRAERRRAAARAPQVAPGLRAHQVLVAQELRRFSLYSGVDPNLVAVTTWAQPWVPLWLEWQVQVHGLDPATLDAWRLGPIDHEPAREDVVFDGQTVTFSGRCMIGSGGARTLHAAIHDFLAAEDKLDDAQAGLVDETVEGDLRTLAEAVKRLDVLTATLDGLRLQLLGLAAQEGVHRAKGTDGQLVPPTLVGTPHGVWAGSLELRRARLIDAFGRTLEVPVQQVATPSRANLASLKGQLLAPPRLLRPARWLLRLVDAATPVGAEGTEARVDQVDMRLQVNPVAGFLVPDHLDESLEFFDTAGQPIGELLHDALSGGVMWEIAAGRTGPADAGPLYALRPAQQPLGQLAAGLVAADARGRLGGLAEGESALSALLRAIDTTLWSVDTLATLGSEHVAGLVGRPLAVVRAQLRLALKPSDDIDLSRPEHAAAWDKAQAHAARIPWPVRVGEITRSDDGVVAFFVDDNFSQARLVDKSVAGAATALGRNQGHLGLMGTQGEPPKSQPLAHGYIAGRDDDDVLHLHLGQTLTLTLLMHPAGKLHLTSGVLPRKALGLARDWVAPGLAAVAPSLRCGPLLVETDLDAKGQVRLPKISVLGAKQNFLWRDTPATWRTDAILAATQTALLPDAPAELREGWIRVAPDSGAAQGEVTE